MSYAEGPFLTPRRARSRQGICGIGPRSPSTGPALCPRNSPVDTRAHVVPSVNRSPRGCRERPRCPGLARRGHLLRARQVPPKAGSRLHPPPGVAQGHFLVQDAGTGRHPFAHRPRPESAQVVSQRLSAMVNRTLQHVGDRLDAPTVRGSQENPLLHKNIGSSLAEIRSEQQVTGPVSVFGSRNPKGACSSSAACPLQSLPGRRGVFEIWGGWTSGRGPSCLRCDRCAHAQARNWRGVPGLFQLSHPTTPLPPPPPPPPPPPCALLQRSGKARMRTPLKVSAGFVER